MPITQRNEIKAVESISNQLSSFDKEAKKRILRASSEITETSDTVWSTEKDIMSTLFAVFKTSIEETNKDKAYFLTKLSEMNELAEAFGEYLEGLNKIATDLGNGQKTRVDISPIKARLVENEDICSELEKGTNLFPRPVKKIVDLPELLKEMSKASTVLKKLLQCGKKTFAKARENDELVLTRLKIQETSLNAVKQIVSIST